MQQILELEATKNFLSKIDKNAYNILSKWNDAKEITNDEKLANLVGEKVTVVRSTLNKLSFRGIVNYKKEKDQKSGWYNFYWSFDFKKLAMLVTKEHIEKKRKLVEKLKQLSNYDYFVCKNYCHEFPFEVAAEYNFVCPHCNQNLELINKKAQNKKINAEISNIEKDLSFIRKLYF